MKKIISMLLAVSMCFSMGISAVASNTKEITATGGVKIYDKDGDLITTLDSNLSADVEFDTKMYINVSDLFTDQGLDVSDLKSDKLVRFSAKKDTGGKYISKISLATEKKLGKLPRGSYITLTSSDSLSVDEEKVRFTVKFRTREDGVLDSGSLSGDQYEATFTLWISNPKVSDYIEAGKRGIYEPEENDESEITWSDSDGDIAMLKFNVDSDSEKMYIKLSTKVVEDLYAKYGDPVNADLYFRTFPGIKNISSTSRASLYLYNPWEYDYSVVPTEIYIYSYADGKLTDVSNNFVWDENEGAWITRTRSLETYILSDKKLNTESDSLSTNSKSGTINRIQSVNKNSTGTSLIKGIAKKS